jgi:hypothetical protein
MYNEEVQEPTKTKTWRHFSLMVQENNKQIPSQI